MRDFTKEAYENLILALQEANYRILTVAEYAEQEKENALPQISAEREMESAAVATMQMKCEDGGGAPVAILRHDVDKHPERSLQIAELEASKGVRATYYFRIVPCSLDKDIIRQISALGHEIGYHYEDLALAHGDTKKAMQLFDTHLDMLREIEPIRTICMHGSPLSKYDNRALWQPERSYKERGILAEPYLDLDYSRLLYLTDTGRCWDGERYSIRDKIRQPVGQQADKRRTQLSNERILLHPHSTWDVVQLLQKNVAAGGCRRDVLITTHPQRWNSTMGPWLAELVMQSVKNLIKAAVNN